MALRKNVWVPAKERLVPRSLPKHNLPPPVGTNRVSMDSVDKTSTSLRVDADESVSC